LIRPSIRPLSTPLSNTPRWLRRPAITLTGVTLLAVGAALLVLPGPGLLVLAAGLAVLAAEYPAAQRLLDRLKARLPRQLRRR
jgi:hypothetical protein